MRTQTPIRGGHIAVHQRHGIASAIARALYRFCSGQVVVRYPTRWDARYLTWAPPMPEEVAMSRERGPRTTWARRPGYQRQAVRVAAIATVIGYWTHPGPTVCIVAVVGAVAIARAIRSAHRRHLYAGVIATWWPYVAGKTGVDLDDAPRWVRFPTAEEVRWEPVTPLAALVRPVPDADAAARQGSDVAPDRGGLLTRACPPIARWLRPMTAPVTEWGWIITARERFAGDRRVWIAVLARTLETLIRTAEHSRAYRVRPLVIRRDLGADDARVEIFYPPTYPAHPQDVAEIQRVLRERLPARTVDQDAPADEDDDEDVDEVALPPGAWTARNDQRRLCIVFERARLMPSVCNLDMVEFGRHSWDMIPIGVTLTRGGRSRVVTIPLKAKTPHISVAASTGWGKTTVANVLGGHLLYHGAYGVILDPKKIGYVDAYRGASPNVEIRTSRDGWMDAIERVRDEMNRRYMLMEQCADRVQQLGLPKMTENAELYFMPLFLLEDEKGSLTVDIAQWFKREGGPDGKPGKGTPPTFEQQQEILWRGRAGAVHMITLAQQNNARVFLNTDMRDQYMFRILAGPQTRQSWEMTFPGTKKRSIPRKKGRGVFGVGPEGIQNVQLGRISDEEARACAIHGIAVADRDNQIRAELLALATGRPEWEVSPLPFWVPSPVQTAPDVPGHGPDVDTPRAAEERALHVVRTSDVDDSDDDDIESEIIEMIDVTAAEPVAENADLIVGEAQAAEFLGISQAAFKQRRKRAKKGLCPEIRGEVQVGRSLAWPALELTEWNNQFRTAS